MGFYSKIIGFIKKYFFETNWRCAVCGKEIFDGEYFCHECESQLPFNDKAICNHCGRKVVAPEQYCSTCKDRLLSVDKGRSVFVYDKPISGLIKSAKYDGKRCILEAFADYLASAYFKNYFNADYITFVPMTEKAEKTRGYNQSKVLSKMLSEKVNVEFIDCLIKAKETERQATLDRNQRMKNLQGVFKVVNRKKIKEKSVLIVDDVATTGATSENIAKVLKKAGAKNVFLLTVASVSPKEGY